MRFSLISLVLLLGAGQALAQYPAAPQPPVQQSGPARIMVLNGCGTADTSRGIAADLLAGGFNVVKIARSPRQDYLATTIIFQAAYYNDAVNLSRRISGTKRLARASAPSPSADIFVITACDARPFAQAGPGLYQPPARSIQLARRGPMPIILPSVNGGSGLVAMPTADVLPLGSWEGSAFLDWSFHLLPDEYLKQNITGLPKQDADLQASINWGAWKNLEVGAMLPLSVASGIKNQAGLKNIRANVRYGFLQDPKDPYKLAVSGFIGVPSAGKNLGSTQASGGAQVNFSYLFSEGKKSSLNINLGFELSDYISKSDPLKGYEAASKFNGSLGYAYRAVEQLMLSLELLGTSALGRAGQDDIIKIGDEDFYGFFGLRILPSPRTLITLGGGVGLPPDPLRPDTNYIVIGGLSYLFLQTKLSPIPLPSGRPALPPAAKRGPREMRVMVLNGCATFDPTRDISSKVMSAGFNVTKIGRAPQQTYTSSMIIFQPEYYAEAVSISRQIPGALRLARASRPTPTVDVYVIGGCSAIPPAMAPAPLPTPPPGYAAPQAPAPITPAPAPMAPAPAAPAAPYAPAPAPAPAPPPVKKKALTEMKIELQDGCGKPGVVENVGKPLIINGLNINKIGKASQRNMSQTEIQYKEPYLAEAQKVAAYLKGTPKFTSKTAPGEEELTIIIGCDQK